MKVDRWESKMEEAMITRVLGCYARDRLGREKSFGESCGYDPI